MENNNVKVGLVIMASGLSKRFGSNKLMTNLGNKPLVSWIVDTTDGLFDKRVVVTRNKDVEMLCLKQNIKCIYHEFPGRNDTVRLGLSEIMKDVDICFFMPGDQPLIKRETISKLISVARNNPEMITRTGHNDVVGSPMGFPRSVYDELLILPQGKGGGFVARMHPELINIVPVDDEYELMDIDTTDDLELIKRHINLV